MIWLEIHCDARIPAIDAAGNTLCHSMRGDSYGAISANITKATCVLRELARTAKLHGWELKGGMWTCPACLRAIARSMEAKS